MTYLYDVINKSNRGMWVAAEDKVDAAVIAHDLKHTQEIENAQVEGPLKVVDDKLKAWLEVGHRGHLGYQVPTQTIEQILSGKVSPSGEWFFIKKVIHE